MTKGNERSEALNLLEKRLLGSSEAMERIRKTILMLAPLEDPVLVLGESGVGKGLVAELIHSLSGRCGQFVTVDVPNMKGELFESKLFGYRKGAYTGAFLDMPGIVDEARGGTLFFDEISEIPIDFQARLLRFIETHTYHVLGDSKLKSADIRVITASNQNIKAMLKLGNFRNDLFYRINVFQISIPPLRAHINDVKDIIEMGGYIKNKSARKDFWDALMSYQWPGNVRELISVSRRLSICEHRILSKKIIEEFLKLDDFSKSRDEIGNDRAIEEIWQELRLGKDFWTAVKKRYIDREINRSQLKCFIEEGLTMSNGKLIDICPIINISRSDYPKLKSFLCRNYIKVRARTPLERPGVLLK